MNQPVDAPPIPFEQLVSRVLQAAIVRLEQEGQRLGIPHAQLQNLVADYAIAYLEGKRP